MSNNKYLDNFSFNFTIDNTIIEEETLIRIESNNIIQDNNTIYPNLDIEINIPGYIQEESNSIDNIKNEIKTNLNIENNSKINIENDSKIDRDIKSKNTNDTYIKIKNKLKQYNEECVICLDDINLGSKHIEYDILVLECNHAFHYQCYLQWVIDSNQVFYNKTKCPLCNQFVSNKTNYHINLRKKHHHCIENLGKEKDTTNNPFF